MIAFSLTPEGQPGVALTVFAASARLHITSTQIGESFGKTTLEPPDCTLRPIPRPATGCGSTLPRGRAEIRPQALLGCRVRPGMGDPS